MPLLLFNFRKVTMVDIDSLLSKLHKTDAINERIDILSNIIDYCNYKKEESNLYKYIKDWFVLYIDSLENNTYGYNLLNYKKVDKKIDLLKEKEKVHFLGFTTRHLKKKYLNEDARYYEKRYFDEDLAYCKKNNFIIYIAKFVTNSLVSLVVFFIIFIILFSLPLLKKDIFPNILKISFSENSFVNNIATVVSSVFNLISFPQLNFIEILYLLSLKSFFYIFITYYLLKLISKRVYID